MSKHRRRINRPREIRTRSNYNVGSLRRQLNMICAKVWAIQVKLEKNKHLEFEDPKGLLDTLNEHRDRIRQLSRQIRRRMRGLPTKIAELITQTFESIRMCRSVVKTIAA